MFTNTSTIILLPHYLGWCWMHSLRHLSWSVDFTKSCVASNRTSAPINFKCPSLAFILTFNLGLSWSVLDLYRPLLWFWVPHVGEMTFKVTSLLATAGVSRCLTWGAWMGWIFTWKWTIVWKSPKSMHKCCRGHDSNSRWLSSQPSPCSWAALKEKWGWNVIKVIWRHGRNRQINAWQHMIQAISPCSSQDPEHFICCSVWLHFYVEERMCWPALRYVISPLFTSFCGFSNPGLRKWVKL